MNTVILIIALLMPQEKPALYYSDAYKCPHTEYQWKDHMTAIAVLSDSLMIIGKDFGNYRGKVVYEETRNYDRHIIATRETIIEVTPYLIYWIMPNKERVLLKRIPKNEEKYYQRTLRRAARREGGAYQTALPLL